MGEGGEVRREEEGKEAVSPTLFYQSLTSLSLSLFNRTYRSTVKVHTAVLYATVHTSSVCPRADLYLNSIGRELPLYFSKFTNSSR